jgi:hypothetical protein
METNENMPAETSADQEFEQLPSDVSEAAGNLEICPNCLEPNTENLAVCKYCGMPLHQGSDPDEYLMKKESENLEANRAESVPEAKKSEKKQENGFRRVMPWLGLYLIYYAITGCFDVNRQIKQAAEEGQTVNAPLAYVSQGIWLVAGIMMALPLIKKGYRKLRGLPEPEEDETPAEEQAEVTKTEETGEEAVSENTESQPGEVASDGAVPETDTAPEPLPEQKEAEAAEEEIDIPEA